MGHGSRLSHREYRFVSSKSTAQQMYVLADKSPSLNYHKIVTFDLSTHYSPSKHLYLQYLEVIVSFAVYYSHN